MKTGSGADDVQIFESFNTLLHNIQSDPLIHQKIITLLTMVSFQRRSVLNYWLERLKNQNAHGNLCQALVCLFDDTISAYVLETISHHQD